MKTAIKTSEYKSEHEIVVDDIRLELRDLLFRNAASGRLQQTMKDMSTDKLRKKARNILSQTADDGRLQQALASGRNFTPPEVVLTDSTRNTPPPDPNWDIAGAGVGAFGLQAAGLLVPPARVAGLALELAAPAQTMRRFGGCDAAEDVLDCDADDTIGGRGGFWDVAGAAFGVLAGRALEGAGAVTQGDLGKALVDALPHQRFGSIREESQASPARHLSESTYKDVLACALGGTDTEDNRSTIVDPEDYLSVCGTASLAAGSTEVTRLPESINTAPRPPKSADWDTAWFCASRICHHVAETPENRSTVFSVSPRPVSANGVEAARKKAQHLLSNAVLDGSLTEILQTTTRKNHNAVKGLRISDLRLQACQRMNAAAEDGTLFSILQEIDQEKTLANARKRAKLALTMALDGGTLAATLDEVQQENSLANMRWRAKKVLENALDSGILSVTLDEVYQEKTSKTQNIVSPSVNDSTLCPKLDEGISKTARLHSEKKSMLETLRLQAQGVLWKSVNDGRLCAAIDEVTSVMQKHEAAKDRSQGPAIAAARHWDEEFRVRLREESTSASLQIEATSMVSKLAHSPPTHPPAMPSMSAPRRKRLNLPLTVGAPARVTLLEMIQNSNRSVGLLHAQIEEAERAIQDRTRVISAMEEDLRVAQADARQLAIDLDWHKKQIDDSAHRGDRLGEHRRIVALELEEMRKGRLGGANRHVGDRVVGCGGGGAGGSEKEPNAMPSPASTASTARIAWQSEPPTHRTLPRLQLASLP
eukprot:TRINITY_DN46051_c0_g1_i1.p1 TRINITY_DN46051_c0_g1~~TRINITY_DN46051_c0_g1_i1.p1  ORF type:complete len:889 (-),score=174.98 TRINITY_DN46051_c0_g1_i1:90-2384(-)